MNTAEMIVLLWVTWFNTTINVAVTSHNGQILIHNYSNCNMPP